MCELYILFSVHVIMYICIYIYMYVYMYISLYNHIVCMYM